VAIRRLHGACDTRTFQGAGCGFALSFLVGLSLLHHGCCQEHSLGHMLLACRVTVHGLARRSAAQQRDLQFEPRPNETGKSRNTECTVGECEEACRVHNHRNDCGRGDFTSRATVGATGGRRIRSRLQLDVIRGTQRLLRARARGRLSHARANGGHMVRVRFFALVLN
jgi:hypothetical protein